MVMFLAWNSTNILDFKEGQYFRFGVSKHQSIFDGIDFDFSLEISWTYLSDYFGFGPLGTGFLFPVYSKILPAMILSRIKRSLAVIVT